MRAWRWLAGAVVAAGVARDSAAQGPPPASVMLADTAVEVIAQQREVTGQVRSRVRSTLAGQEPGLVMEITLEEGDRVEAGQVVARLDAGLLERSAAEARARVAVAESVVVQRRAELAQWKRDWERTQELVSRGSASASETDAVRSRVEVGEAALSASEAQVAQERATLAIVEKRLADMTITAPFAGVVVGKHAEMGQWVAAGDAVVTVVATDRLEVTIDVPEAFVDLLTPGASVPVTVRGLSADVEGKLVAIVPQADELSRLFPVRLEVPARTGDGRELRAGMSVTALVPTAERQETLLVSKDAILRNDAGEFVYFDAGGVGAVGPIQRLFAVGDRVAVRSPVLRGGMRVVVQGNERMFPGQPLVVLNADEFPDVAARQAAGAGGGPGGGGGGASAEKAGE
jgi:RND family efflux transporter MFP subunit